jgi:hypothetical protein
MSYQDLPLRLSALQSQLSNLEGRRHVISSEVERLKVQVSSLAEEEVVCDLSTALIRQLIDREVSDAVRSVEELLTEGLRVVFDDQDLSVKAVVDVSRGKVSVDFMTQQRNSDGTTTTGLSREAFGGAVTTVQSILLRIIVTLRRGLRPIIFLDESLPAFDNHYVHNMGLFLKSLCAKMGFDILLVTHNPAMLESADHAYRISKVDGVANFKRLR